MEMETDLFHWIWYTGNFVNAAEKARINCPTKAIGDIYSEFINENPLLQRNAGSFTLVNQGLIMVMAYAICVIPRERFDKFANFDCPLHSMDLFGVIKDTRKAVGNRSVFLRKIRNAVAHVNIEFIPNVPVEDPSGVKLWNINKGNTDFKVSISVRNFMVFLNELGHQADVYLNSTTDPR